MGYPTSVFSPASRSNGQTIDASHVNDVQAELTAIENALLGTITHSLNVSGASTFTIRPVTPPPQAALVFLESTGAMGSSAESTLAFTGQAFLTNSSMHSTTTNPSRLTPQSTGIYRITAQAQLSSNASTGSRALVLDDSTGNIAITRFMDGAHSHVMQVTGYKRFDVLGGYITCRVSVTAPSTLSIATGVAATWLAMEKL